jgi:hypothetical protein
LRRAEKMERGRGGMLDCVNSGFNGQGDELPGMNKVPHGIYTGHHARFTTYILFRTLVRVDIISQRYALLQTHSTPQMRLLSCYCYVSLERVVFPAVIFLPKAPLPQARPCFAPLKSLRGHVSTITASKSIATGPRIR